jgi:hypothetical protein
MYSISFPDVASADSSILVIADIMRSPILLKYVDLQRVVCRIFAGQNNYRKEEKGDYRGEQPLHSISLALRSN